VPMKYRSLSTASMQWLLPIFELKKLSSGSLSFENPLRLQSNVFLSYHCHRQQPLVEKVCRPFDAESNWGMSG
jgi:hypothetical protein